MRYESNMKSNMRYEIKYEIWNQIWDKSYGGMEVRDSNNDLIDHNTGKTIDEKEILFARCIALIAAALHGTNFTFVSKSAFICSLAVIFVPILNAISGKSLSLQKALGAIIAVAGVALLELGYQSSLSLSHGDMLSLVQPMVFGIGFWRMFIATLNESIIRKGIASMKLMVT